MFLVGRGGWGCAGKDSVSNQDAGNFFLAIAFIININVTADTLKTQEITRNGSIFCYKFCAPEKCCI